MKKLNKVALSTNEQVAPRVWNSGVELLRQREMDLLSQRVVKFDIPFRWVDVVGLQGASYSNKRTVELPFDARLVDVFFDGGNGNDVDITCTISSTDLDDDIVFTHAANAADTVYHEMVNTGITSGTATHATLSWSGSVFTNDMQVTLRFEMDACGHLAAFEYLEAIRLSVADTLSAAKANNMFEAHEANLDLLDAAPSSVDGIKARTSNVMEWGEGFNFPAAPATTDRRYMNDFVDGWYVDEIDCYFEGDVGYTLTFELFNPAGGSLGSVAVAGAGMGSTASGSIGGLGETSTGDGYYMTITKSGSGSGYVAWSVLHCTSGKGY